MSHGFKGGDDLGNLTRILRLSILVLCIPYGIWTIIGMLFGQEMLAMLYTESYKGYATLFSLFLVKTSIDSVTAPLANFLQTIERADINTKSLILGMVVTLVLGSVLITAYGVNGAGVTGIAASLATWVWRYVYFKNAVKAHLSKNSRNVAGAN
jgi:O-antigen/teichoic acid export membrane protein